jgi:hypothetical protein
MRGDREAADQMSVVLVNITMKIDTNTPIEHNPPDATKKNNEISIGILDIPYVIFSIRLISGDMEGSHIEKHNSKKERLKLHVTSQEVSEMIGITTLRYAPSSPIESFSIHECQTSSPGPSRNNITCPSSRDTGFLTHPTPFQIEHPCL